MSTRQYSNYADLITFSRASGGTALRPISYGDELVTNGTFDTDTTGWTGYNFQGHDVTLSSVSGQLNIENDLVDGGNAAAYQSISTVAGQVYLLTFDWVSTSGRVMARDGNFLGTAVGDLSITSSGAKNITFIAASNTTFLMFMQNTTVAGTTRIVDNISVREVLFDQAGAPLTLFNHPADTPRVEYDADGNRLGLLVEEARTNLTISSDFSSDYWNAVRASKAVNVIVSPDGTQNADAIIATDSNSHYVYDVFSTTASSRYTASVFAKSGNQNFVTIYDGTGNTFFNLSTGVVETLSPYNNVSAQIENFGNGWYKCSVSFDALDASYNMAVGSSASGTNNVYIGDSSSEEVYIYGAQLEAGAFPTSYIPTAGATATRSADIASIPVADFGYNQSEGTVVVEADTNSSGIVTNLNDGSESNRAFIYMDSSYQGLITSGGVAQAVLDNGTVLVNTPQKIAMAIKANDFALSLDGTPATTDAAGVSPIDISTLTIGSRLANIGSLNGHIKSIKYYPRRLSNAQLQELTS